MQRCGRLGCSAVARLRWRSQSEAVRAQLEDKRRSGRALVRSCVDEGGVACARGA
jgi:hypothetical protein